MANTNERPSEPTTEARPAPPEAVRAGTTAGSPGAAADQAVPAEPHPAPMTSFRPGSPPRVPEGTTPSHPLRKWLILAAVVAGLAVGAYFLVPWIITALTTVSTDDAYVNGHVTFVAPRVSGQVTKVLVDDNYRVKKGDLLVQLDKEPYQVQLAIKQAAVKAAESDLVAANAQVRGQVAQTRAARFQLRHTIEQVDNQIANLRAAVATLNSKKATLTLARSNLKRGEELQPSGGISKEELDQRKQTVKVDEAEVDQALQQVYAIRASLGIPDKPPEGQELTDVPPNLDQTFSAVRQALGTLMQDAAQFGYFPASWETTPKQTVADFYQHDPLGYTNLIGQTLGAAGLAPVMPPMGALTQVIVALEVREEESLAIDRILALIIPNAPAIQQAEAKLLQARRDLAQAELNLRYCDVYSDIDGQVTSRNVNEGNNVLAGQNLMAVRALRPPDLWVDANFKETQLADLRIGQRVRLEVDMYGSRREFQGRISGFTMGTGQTLALLPPQNATGNFVKIVQRLPVRIEVIDYDPDKDPLFVGLSVTPYVYYKEPATGPHAGEFLQPFAPLPQGSYPKTLQELEQPPSPTAPAARPQP
jgi:membrane fusion protein, multidrug efflux system